MAGIRLALGLLTVALVAAAVVTGIETWQARARHQALTDSGLWTARAVDLGASATTYGQGIREYLDAPDVGSRTRLLEIARDMAAEFDALVAHAATDEERCRGREARALQMRLAVEGQSLLAADLPLPVAELTRRAASDPHPARVEHGRSLTDFTGGAVPVTDAAAVASPAPPASVFR